MSNTFNCVRMELSLGGHPEIKKNGRFLFKHFTIILFYISYIQCFIEYSHFAEEVSLYILKGGMLNQKVLKAIAKSKMNTFNPTV